MPSFVPDLATLIPFLVAALTLNLTPGTDMTYVVSALMRRLSALVFLSLAVQFALGQRPRS